MDFASLVFNALAANPDIVTPHATAYANNAADNSYTVDEIISPKTLSILKAELPVPVVYTAKKPANAGDHPAATAMRSVLRQMFDKAISVFPNSIFLHVGATAREISRHKADKNHHYALHGKEAKDEGRNAILVDMIKGEILQAHTRAELLEGLAARDTALSKQVANARERLTEWQTEMGRRLASGRLLTEKNYKYEEQLKAELEKWRKQVRVHKASRRQTGDEKSLRRMLGKNTTAKKFMERVKSFEIGDLSDMEVFTTLFDDVMGLEGRVFSTSAFSTGHSMRSRGTGGFDILTFEDVGYDFTDLDWLEYFFQTGAHTGFVTGMFPLELIHDNLVPARSYCFEKLPFGRARMRFPDGFSNSYEHNFENWARLVSSPFIRGKGAYDFDLHIEIKSRVGPYALIEIHKVPKGNVQSYVSEIPKNRRTVSLLRPSSLSYIARGGKRVIDYTKARRFNFPESQYDQLVVFFRTLDVKSQTLTNMLNFTRRAFEGISLVKDVEAVQWADFPAELIPDLCANVCMTVFCELSDAENVMSLFKTGSAELESQISLPGFFKSLFGPFSMALEHLLTAIPAERLCDFLVVRRPTTRDMSDMTPSSAWTVGVEKTMRNIFLDVSSAGESATPCPVCKQVSGKLGKQKVSCAFKPESKFDVSFSEDECLSLKVDFLKAASEQAGALCDALSDAAKSLLIADHQQICRVEYIRGGPGVGKSWLIRLLYPGMAVASIAVPLIELLADYPRTEVKTTHKFVKAGSKKILFVDEMSIFDGRVLRYMIARHKVDLVYIVGDTEQNKILPDHGQYIGSVFDLDAVSRHSLHQNFRTDSQFIVSRLNKVGKYAMHTASKIPRLPIVRSIEQLATDPTPSGDLLTLHFSDNAEREIFPGAKSVASIQGRTCDVARLILSKYDRALSAQTGQFIVSISRQRQDLYIYADLNETQDFYFWELLGYKKKSFLSDDGKTNVVEMEPTSEAIAYMQAPQELPTNVDLSLDLRRVREVWSETINVSEVDVVSHEFLKTNYHIMRSMVQDREGFEFFAWAKSVPADKPLDELFDCLQGYGVSLRSSGRDTDYVYDESSGRWTGRLSDRSLQVSEIIYEDETRAGLPVKKCFLRAVKSVSNDEDLLLAAYRLCMKHSAGVSMDVALQFMLDNGAPKIGVWETALGYSHPRYNTPVCKVAIELEEGHWQKKKQRRVLIVAGSEKHLPSILSLIQEAVKSNWFVTAEVIELLAYESFMLPEETVLDATSKKPQTAAGRSLRSRLTPDLLSVYRMTIELLVELRRRERPTYAGPDTPRRHVLRFAPGQDFSSALSRTAVSFFLESMFGQGMTVDVLENYHVRDFGAPAEMLRAHLPLPPVFSRTLVVERPMVISSPSVENLGQVPSDSYLSGPEHLPVSYVVKAHSTLNERAASFFSELSATNGKVNPVIFQPRTKAGRIQAAPQPKRAVTIGEGLHYDSKNNAQTLATMVKRYLQPGHTRRSIAGALLARSIARDAARQVLIPGRRLPSDMQEAVFRRHCDDAAKRNYALRALGEGEHNQRRVNFSMKDIFKPAKGQIKADKVGQGISASSAYVNFAFGGGFRVMTAALQYALQPHVVIDNGYTQSEFLNMVGERLEQLPGKPDTCILDVEAMDSTQNWFTMEMEKEFWKILGIAPDFVEEYFTFRENYPIFYLDVIKATVASAKGSGMPDTLIGNCLIIMMMALHGVKKTGKFFMIVKGDDCAIWGYRLAYNEENMLSIRRYSKFKFSIDINVPMEFCGNAVEGKFMCPDLYRILRKITGNRFKDYQHWTEYQKSLRDQLSLIWQMGFSKVVGVNAARCGVSEGRMYDVLYAIVSYSHIDREQWDAHFTKVVYPDPYGRL